MAVVNQTSNGVTNTQNKTLSNPYQVNGDTVESVGFVPVATSDNIGSTYRLVRVRSSTRLSSLQVINDALTTMTANLGLYAPNGGAVVSASLFGAAVALGTAGRTELLTTTVVPAAKIEQRIWELLGLSSDPQTEYDLTFTTVAAATAAGNLAVKVQGVI